MGGETTLEGAIDAMGKEREEQVLERIAEFTDEVVVIIRKLQDVVRALRRRPVRRTARRPPASWMLSRARPTTPRKPSSTGCRWAASSR